MYVSRKSILLYDLMTQDSVSGQFSTLVAAFIRKTRQGDGTRFGRKSQREETVATIRRLAFWFRYVEYDSCFQLMYMGRDPYKAQILRTRRHMLEAATQGPDYSESKTTNSHAPLPLFVDY